MTHDDKVAILHWWSQVCSVIVGGPQQALGITSKHLELLHFIHRHAPSDGSFVITSTTRTREQQLRLLSKGGSPMSPHMLNRAIDIDCYPFSKKRNKEFAKAIILSAKTEMPYYHVQTALYDYRFIHVDNALQLDKKEKDIIRIMLRDDASIMLTDEQYEYVRKTMARYYNVKEA